ncbi:hypothetical protein CDAR_365641 [Caerostris darwini]|uniref:Uncharacterized protein n=1 Tax=Caerostris darwini TaxID=1538125 RepID=A0AAV4RHG7_9ARAC|nr:hypothetical protein CDAR_365641 [Caerostris darwini]
MEAVIYALPAPFLPRAPFSLFMRLFPPPEKVLPQQQLLSSQINGRRLNVGFFTIFTSISLRCLNVYKFRLWPSFVVGVRSEKVIKLGFPPRYFVLAGLLQCFP